MAGINLPSIPRISDADLDDAKERRRIMNYLVKLDEQLRYMMTHLGTENLGTELVSVIDSKASAQQVNEVTGNIERVSTRIEQTEREISMKADQEELDALGQTVSSHSTLIQQTAEAITLKADQSDVDSLSGVVNQHTTQIQQNATDISAKASQSSVDALGNRVSSAETSLTLKADQATLTSTANDLQSQIDAVPGKINLAVNNVQVGGTNLLLGTGTAKVTTGLNGSTNQASKPYNLSNKFLSATKNGKKITLSFDWVTTASSGTVGIQTFGTPWGLSGMPAFTISANSGHYSATVTATSALDVTTYTGVRLRFDNVGSSSNVATFTWSNVKLEWGNKATDWSPAPEDTGSRTNLLRHTNPPIAGNHNNGYWEVASGGNGTGSIGTTTDSPVVGVTNTLRISGNTYGNRDWVQNAPFVVGKQHMFSSYVRGIGGNCTALIRVFENSGASNPYSYAVAVGTTWTKLEVLIDASSWPTNSNYSWNFQIGLTGAGSIEYLAPKLELGNTVTAYNESPAELVNNSLVINEKGVFVTGAVIDMQAGSEFNVQSGGVVHIESRNTGSTISFGTSSEPNFSVDESGSVSANSGSFGTNLAVGGQRVLTLADVGIPIKVSTSQPSGHGFIWLQPSSVTSVRYTGYTADSRNSTVMFSTSQRTITRSFAAEASNTLANGTFTYTLTFEVMSLSDAQLTGVTFSASATKGSTVSFSASSAITLTKYQTATITLTATSSTNLASNANAISVAITATASSYGGLFLNSKQWMTLTIAKSGGSGTQACNVYYIP